MAMPVRHEGPASGLAEFFQIPYLQLQIACQKLRNSHLSDYQWIRDLGLTVSSIEWEIIPRFILNQGGSSVNTSHRH